MDMYEFAIKMEKDAEALYLELSDKTAHSGIKKVFKMLADDEMRHREAVEVLQKKAGADPVKGSALKIKTVFDEIKNNLDSSSINNDSISDYRFALEIEKKGIDFYREQFDKAEDDKSKDLFNRLMKQEKYHYKTVENLIELVSKPEWWVENAEFNPLGDDYY